MIELLMLYSMTHTVGRIVRARKRKALGYQALLVVLWFGGEIVGAIIGTVVIAWFGLRSANLIYDIALLGAVTGAWVVHFIIIHLGTPAICPGCGAELGVGYRYPQCGKCGAALTGSLPAVERPLAT